LIPETGLIKLGYFVLFSSNKTEGPVRKFGQILSIWVFIVALLFPTMGAFVTLSGLCPFSAMIQAMG
jgi:hypothetical protein